jgi:hypothetical protein
LEGYGGDKADRWCRWCNKMVQVPKTSVYFTNPGAKEMIQELDKGKFLGEEDLPISKMYTFVKIMNEDSGAPSMGWNLVLSSMSNLLEWHELYGNKMTPYSLFRLAVSISFRTMFDEDILIFFNRYCRRINKKMDIPEVKRLINNLEIYAYFYDNNALLVSESGCLMKMDNKQIMEETEREDMVFPEQKVWEI